MGQRGVGRRVRRLLLPLGSAVLVTACALLYPGDAGVTTVDPARSVHLTTGAPGRADPSEPAPSPSQPPTSPAPPGDDCPTTAGAPGWLAGENARPGTRLEMPSGRPGRAAVLGYADAVSARCGDLVAVHLSGPDGVGACPVRLVAYRIGAYQGLGARRVWQSEPIEPRAHPVPSGAAYPHLVQPTWPATTRLRIDATWPPGFYLLVPTADSGRAAGPAIPLLVRDDAGRAPVLFQASSLTWTAYNDFGGWSLYHGPSGSGAVATANRARVVALRRPLVNSGYEQLQYMDLPVVRQLEALGLDVDYVTDGDVDRDPAVLSRYTEVVYGGHSEYWTRRMYDGLLQAVAAGVNLAFLGANNLWWQARIEPAAAGGDGDRMVVYRDLADDPVARQNPSLATVLWGPAPLHRDPAALLGLSHAAIGVRGGLQFLDAPDWFTAGTGLTTDSVLADAVGNEADGYNPRGGNPVTTQVLAAGVLRGKDGPVVASTEYVTFPSGAAVFTAGTTDWACTPSGRCCDLIPPVRTAVAVGQLTRNVLLTLARPKAGQTHPAKPVVPFVAAQLLPRLAPAAVGHYGGAAAEDPDD